MSQPVRTAGGPAPGRWPLLALVGPTASGKSEAAVPLAEALGAEIVCVDSMVVYRGMDVGTAKPSARDRARVPHHLVDVADPGEPFSVARFQVLAREALDGIRRRGHPALLVGGSALYYRAVADALRFPGTDPGTRSMLEAEAAVLGGRALHRRLVDFDPAAAGRIGPSNVRRTVRALEVAALTGRLFSEHVRALDQYPPGAVRAVGLDIPRDVLHRRIEERVDRIMPGLLAEAEALLARGYGSFLSSSRAIGYAEAAGVVAGTLTEAEAVVRTVRRTKSLARRQMAWFRRDPRIRWFRVESGGGGAIVDDVLAYLLEANEIAAGERP